MIDILTVGFGASMEAFNDALDARGDATVARTGSGAGALDILSEKKMDLVVINETLGDMAGIDLARKVVARNPMAAVGLVSALSGEAFHEATEGLGILAQLPPHPGRGDAGDLLDKLVRVLRLTHRVEALS